MARNNWYIRRELCFSDLYAQELYDFTSDKLITSPEVSHLLVLSDREDKVLTNKEYDTSALSPNNHYEADTKCFLHLIDAVRSGHSKAFIRTVDSDLVIIAIALFQQIENLTHLWIGFGKGKQYYEIAVHNESRKYGPERALALLFFNGITGCDTVSQALDIGKLKSWNAWDKIPELTAVFIKLLNDPTVFYSDPEIFKKLERFMVRCYSSTCSSPTLDVARLKLFETGTKVLETLPPTSAPYFQHVRRAILQASFLWKQSLTALQVVPSYSEWGWKWDGEIWVPLWTTKEIASAACKFLRGCGCKKGCVNDRCKCRKRGDKCSTLCRCGAGCTNNGDDL